jgi:hypothetical protein
MVTFADVERAIASRDPQLGELLVRYLSQDDLSTIRRQRSGFRRPRPVGRSKLLPGTFSKPTFPL